MNYNKTLRYLLDKAEENKKLAFTVFTDKGDSCFAYPEGNKEFYVQIFIENGMVCWAIKGYTYSLDKQEDVRVFVDAYNKNDDRKYVMHFLPWERKIALSNVVPFVDNETAISLLEEVIEYFTTENDFTNNARAFCEQR